MYNSFFCRVYDAFGWNEYPRVFGATLLEWLRANHIGVKSALDLGCGTGVLCETLHEQDIDTLGVDLSSDMVDVARTRAPKLDYTVGDMVSFMPGRTFDLVTCTGDALNHITDMSDIRRVFSNVRRALNPDGLFVFDLLKADEVPLGEPFDAPFSERLTVRFSAERDANGFTTLMIDGYLDGVLEFSERIREKIYDVEAIRAALSEAGFHIVHCADHMPDSESARGTTWFIIAKKGK